MTTSPSPDSLPRLAVIIPSHNGATYLERTLPALLESTCKNYEVVVVDDHSTDNIEKVTSSHAIPLVRHQGPPGAGFARNTGVAHTTAPILVFLDSDVLPHPDTLQRIAVHMADSSVHALFGSYDANPDSPYLPSAFKNLFHHYVHQHARREAHTFWSGCGAIRREVFLKAGEFGPSNLFQMEDIELGYRLHDLGHRILLDPAIQVQHLKRWTLRNLVMTDIFKRGIPWTVMLLRRPGGEKDLNLDNRHRLSALAALLSILTVPAPLLHPLAACVPVFCLVLLLCLQWNLLRFFRQARGPFFAAACVPMLLLYYCYSPLAFGLGILVHLGTRHKNPDSTPSR